MTTTTAKRQGEEATGLGSTNKKVNGSATVTASTSASAGGKQYPRLQQPTSRPLPPKEREVSLAESIPLDAKIQIQFKSKLSPTPSSDVDAEQPSREEEVEETTNTLLVPVNSTPKQLELLLNSLLLKKDEDGEATPYSFYIHETMALVQKSLRDTLLSSSDSFTQEEVLVITYIPQAIFKVRPVTRLAGTLNGHSEAVLQAVFSPDGRGLASGSGDCTVRIWDLDTLTPRFTLTGHTNWVQHVIWTADSLSLISAGMDGTLKIWDPKTGKEEGSILAHRGSPVTCLAVEPLHLNQGKCERMVSGSKDCTVKMWNIKTRQLLFSFTQHTHPITALKWSGLPQGLIYTASRDKTIKVWDTTRGVLVKSLEGHGHWVNGLALSSDFICRTGPWDHTLPKFQFREEMHQAALARYNTFHTSRNSQEILASCSDDFTIILWNVQTSKKPLVRMTGHQQPVNAISFSPDGIYLGSASFDKSVKLWDGASGKFLATLRGHVGSVYSLAFSSDSRKLVSASKDSTCKVWDLGKVNLRDNSAKGAMIHELPGHDDEVYTVDWSPGGDFVCSGSKDHTLKIWRN